MDSKLFQVCLKRTEENRISRGYKAIKAVFRKSMPNYSVKCLSTRMPSMKRERCLGLCRHFVFHSEKRDSLHKFD